MACLPNADGTPLLGICCPSEITAETYGVCVTRYGFPLLSGTCPRRRLFKRMVVDLELGGFLPGSLPPFGSCGLTYRELQTFTCDPLTGDYTVATVESGDPRRRDVNQCNTNGLDSTNSVTTTVNEPTLQRVETIYTGPFGGGLVYRRTVRLEDELIIGDNPGFAAFLDQPIGLNPGFDGGLTDGMGRGLPNYDGEIIFCSSKYSRTQAFAAAYSLDYGIVGAWRWIYYKTVVFSASNACRVRETVGYFGDVTIIGCEALLDPVANGDGIAAVPAAPTVQPRNICPTNYKDLLDSRVTIYTRSPFPSCCAPL